MILFDNATIPGYARFRIPGIVCCADGTLLACCEARREDGDWAEIDILLRRSIDGGRTFSVPAVLVSGAERRQTVNNPVMIAGQEGTVHFLYCVEYGLPETGGGVYYRRSDDSGATWSAPKSITAMTMPERRNVFATGPGHGIQLADGTLFVPCWTVLKEHGREPHSHHPGTVCALTSRDNGETWEIAAFVPKGSCTDPNETAAAQLPDGRIVLSVRDGNTHCRCFSVGDYEAQPDNTENGRRDTPCYRGQPLYPENGRRDTPCYRGQPLYSENGRRDTPCYRGQPLYPENGRRDTPCYQRQPNNTENGRRDTPCDREQPLYPENGRRDTPCYQGQPLPSPLSALRSPLSFSPIEPLPNLPDPVCCAGMIAAGDALFLTHCHHERERKNLTLLRSRDGQSWEPVRAVVPGPAGYSDLAQCGGRLLILCEEGTGIALHSVSL